MDQKWTYRWVLVTAWFATLGFALSACGPAPSPAGGLPAGGEAPKPAAATAKYADELVNLNTFPEPPVNQAGGIPPGDLTATPKLGGLVKVGATARPRMDPHFDIAAAQAWQHRVFANGLLRWDLKCGCPQPDLAESWTVAADGMSYDFKIRKGIRFHNRPPVNGRELTIQDIKWSLDRVSGLEPSPGKQGILFQRFANVKEFQVVNDTTLRMVMKQPDVQILAEVMHDYIVTLPKEAAIDNTYEQAKTLIGTGPFIVEYAEPAGQYRFKRNPDYWEKDQAGRQLPYLDEILMMGQSDAATKQAAFKTRQVDWMKLGYEAAQSLFGDPSVRYYNTRGMGIGSLGFFMNTTKAPFNDLRVRRAVHLAIDREEFIDVVYGGPQSQYVVSHFGAWQPWHWPEDKMWSLPGYAKGEAKQKEIAEAKRLLAEAGYANGIKNLNFWNEGSGGVFFEVLQKQLGAIGIEIKLNTVGTQQQRYASFMKDREIAYAGMGGGHTPDYAVTMAWLCDSVQNMSLYCDKEFDRLFFEERRERDTAKRIQLLDKMQQMIWDAMPMAPLSRGANLDMSYTYVKGWRNQWYDNNMSQGFQMAYVWLDK